MKILGYILVLGIVVVGLFYALNTYIYNEKQGDGESQTSEEIGPLTLEGVVTSVNLDGMALDGPALISFKTEAGESHVIAVPSMGVLLCAASSEIASPSAVAIGDIVSVRGALDVEAGYIVLCEDASDYFRITGIENNASLGLSFSFEKGPNGYLLEDSIAGMSIDPDFKAGYMLTRESDVREMLMSDEPREGAPTMQIRVYENTKNLWPAVWAMEHPLESNIELAFSEPEEVTVGGAKAVRFIADGLYASTVYVVTNGSYVYVLTGAYITEDDVIKADFDALVASVVFTEGI